MARQRPQRITVGIDDLPGAGGRARHHSRRTSPGAGGPRLDRDWSPHS
jgi:hypothetical protein